MRSRKIRIVHRSPMMSSVRAIGHRMSYGADIGIGSRINPQFSDLPQGNMPVMGIIVTPIEKVTILIKASFSEGRAK